MNLKAVFFDMGGTIETFRFTRELRIERSALIRECLLKAGISLPLSNEALADLITQGAIAYNRWNMQTNIELPPAQIWTKYYLQDFAIDPQVLEPVGEELSFLYETQLFIREMRPEIPAVLNHIKSLGLTIGCISNTQSTTQVPHSLARYGIADYFDPIVLSSAYGRRKPDPAIFYYAARLANCPTRACIYVGDKINRDVLGSKRAGYRLSVKIVHTYDNGELDQGAVPDAVIHDMTELLPIIEKELERDKLFAISQKQAAVKALFFDAGDILYYRPRKNEHLKLFLEGKKLSLTLNFEEEKAHLKDLAFMGQIKRHDYYEQIIRLYGIDNPAEIAEGVRAIGEDDESVEIFENVPETIQELKKRGFLLGIITDTAMPFSNKLKWFAEHGFGDVWDVMISSREIGLRKPEATMYELALQQTGVEPSQAVFIGHKTSELTGARKVGLKTIAFNYDKDAEADLYIQNFCDLLKLPLLEI